MNIGRLFQPRQAKKPILSENSLNRSTKETVAKSIWSQLTHPSKNLAPKGRVNRRSGWILKPNTRTTFGVSEAGFARFLKEHSSPKHHRVTASGRIIPMESSDECVPGQAQELPRIAEASANVVHLTGPIDMPGANDFIFPEPQGAFVGPYQASFFASALGKPQAFSFPPRRINWPDGLYQTSVLNPGAEPFVPYRASPIPSVNQSPSSGSPNDIEDWLAWNGQTGFMPNSNGSQSSISFTPSMENFSETLPTPMIETVATVIPGLGGTIAINDTEFAMLFALFYQPATEIPLDYVDGILNGILINLTNFWCGEMWHTARASLECLVRVCESHLRVVNMVAARSPDTSEDIVKQRYYYTNLRVMFSGYHDRLTNEWNMQNLAARFAFEDRHQEHAGENVLGSDSNPRAPYTSLWWGDLTVLRSPVRHRKSVA
ncbi:hypothetical protein N7512_008558 [Penicillium capsulatum]|nr:hypothetical protein N7512_008558 [Penicillium capsulatum]